MNTAIVGLAEDDEVSTRPVPRVDDLAMVEASVSRTPPTTPGSVGRGQEHVDQVPELGVCVLIAAFGDPFHGQRVDQLGMSGVAQERRDGSELIDRSVHTEVIAVVPGAVMVEAGFTVGADGSIKILEHAF